MKAKNVLTLLTVVVGIMVFALPAGADYSAENRSPGDVLTPCKCTVGNVPCAGTSTQTGVQGAVIVVDEPARPFDFDGDPAGVSDLYGFGSYGYCSGYNFADDPTRNCKLIFDVCSCDEACEIKAGSTMGIQMSILTEGVYWADPDINRIYFDMFDTTTEICATDGAKNPTVTAMRAVPYYLDEDTGAFVSGEDMPAPTGQGIRYFGGITYYRTVTEGTYYPDEIAQQHLMFKSTVSAVGNPLGGEYKGSVPVGNRVTILESPKTADYMFTIYDTVTRAGQCKIWIDVPAMRIDPTYQKAGQVIQLQVRLIFNREPVGICPECDPPDYCDGVVDIAIMCCGEEGVISGTGGIFFPYVFQGLDNWSSGIAVSALDREQLPEDAYCELTIKDQEGNIATWTKTDMGNKLVWAFVLDQIMSNFAMTQGTALVPGAASLEIRSNYRMDGYSFMMADMSGSYFGAGTLARGIGGKCCP